MIRYNKFLVFLGGENFKKFKIKNLIFGSIGWVRVRSDLTQKFTDFLDSVYFAFGSRKSCSEFKFSCRFWSDFRVGSISDRSMYDTSSWVELILLGYHFVLIDVADEC